MKANFGYDLSMSSEYRPSHVWRLTKNLGFTKELTGTNCSNCGILHFPGRSICPDCGHGRISISEIEPVANTVTASQEDNSLD